MKSQQVNPLLILMLALGVFGIITTEMGIVGVLPQVAHKFGISAAQAGWLVSIFALVVAIAGPFLTLLASGMNRKIILLAAVLMFAISNVVYAYATTFDTMLIFRIIPALFHPVFFSVALVTSAQLVPAEKSSQAVAKVFTGVTAGFAFGVPLTSYLAERLSLEIAFLFGAMVSVVALIGIWIWLPSMPVKEKMSYGKQARYSAQTWIMAECCRSHFYIRRHVLRIQLFRRVSWTGHPHERIMDQCHADRLWCRHDHRKFGVWTVSA